MAQTVTIEGQTYLRREPLGVLGLSFITLGIYFLYWYYKINEELMRFEHDETISPTRSLMAMLFGWIIIVPPFIAMYNTAKHVQTAEQRRGVTRPPAGARPYRSSHADALDRQRDLHPGTPQPSIRCRAAGASASLPAGTPTEPAPRMPEPPS